MPNYRALSDFAPSPQRRCRTGSFTGLRAAALALAFGVSACKSKPPPPAPEPVVMAPIATPAPVEPAPAPPKPKPARPKPVVKAPPALALQDPPADAAVINQVIGMSQDDLRTAFGEPAERIDQGPGQAWIYRTSKCTVEVLFFLDVTRNGYYALDRKLSGPTIAGTGDLSERACYSEIQNARHH